MRLHNLTLAEFKNLRDFSISFDSQSGVSVLVGRNGTGKSNILEALTLIFRDLDLGQPASITFSIEYECRGRNVRVESDKDGKYSTWVDGDRVAASRIIGSGTNKLRPDFVFGYYSGPSNRLEQHFVQHQDRFYRDLVDGSNDPLRPLFYARAVHSNFVLLAFFVEQDEKVQELLVEHLGINGLDSVIFEIQEPTWKSAHGDPRFWNARGTVQHFLDELYRLSLAPMRMNKRLRTGIRRTVKHEHLFLFLPSLDAVRQLRRHYRSNQDFFKALESTYISELIHDVRIRVSLQKAGAPLTFRELSEGEQQLLLVLGLMRFTKEDESLFLLDEPDTHLNPAWSVQYRRFLDVIGGLGAKSQVLMATHDPLVVSALTRNEVRILERDDQGRVHAIRPLEDPQGMGIGNLLTSDVYGLRAQLDIVTLEKIEEKRFLAARQVLTPTEEERLTSLANELRDLGFLMEDRDPDFQEYVRAKYATTSGPSSRQVYRSQDAVEAERVLAEALYEELQSRPVESPTGEEPTV